MEFIAYSAVIFWLVVVPIIGFFKKLQEKEKARQAEIWEAEAIRLLDGYPEMAPEQREIALILHLNSRKA